MATYTTDPEGGALAAVRGGTVLLVPVEAADALNDLWDDLADVDPTRAVLDRLTADGLSDTPSFALAVRGEGRAEVRVVVRGPFSVRVDLDLVDGAGVSTWVERVVRGRTVILKATDATAGGPQTLPIVEGVVPAASVTSTAVEIVAEASPAQPEPVEAAPEPAAASPEPTSALPTAPVTAPAFPNPPAPPAPAAAEPVASAAVDDATVVSVSGFGAASSSAGHAGTEQTIIPPAETQSDEADPGEAHPAGDHDGMTIVGHDLQRLREQRDRRADRAPAPASPEASTPTRALGLRMPDGTVEPISHEVVLGRSPSATQLAGGRLPRVVAIGAGDQDISRNHVRVTVEGDTVVVTDLHSRNGTHVAQPGKAPVRLRAGEPTPVLTGTVVDLGGGWTLQVVSL